MRVNVYAEEMTDKVEIIEKDGFTGVRFYLELPVTNPDGTQHQGPFLHRPGDDDSGAVTFWGKKALRGVLQKALGLLDIRDSGMLHLFKLQCYTTYWVAAPDKEAAIHEVVKGFSGGVAHNFREHAVVTEVPKALWGDVYVYDSGVLEAHPIRRDMNKATETKIIATSD